MKDLNNTISTLQEAQEDNIKKVKALIKCKQSEKNKLKNGYIWKRIDNKTLVLSKKEKP